MDACPSNRGERGTVLIRIDLLGGRSWWGGDSYSCVSRNLVNWLLTAGEGRRGRRQFGTLVSSFVLRERLVLCGACRKYRGSFQIGSVVVECTKFPCSNGFNFSISSQHGIEVKVGRHKHDKITSFEGVYL